MTDKSELTLREAVEQFRAQNTALVANRDLSTEATEFFRCHDTAHVVFGCDSSLFGEGVVKMFTLWGTSLGVRGHFAGYREAEAFSLFRQYSVRHVVRHVARLLVAAPGVFTRARRMHKPWPWSDHGDYLDVPLREIRREFNIEILAREPPASPE